MRSQFILATLVLLLSGATAQGGTEITTNDFIQMCGAAPDDFCISQFQKADYATSRLTPGGSDYRHCSPALDVSSRQAIMDSLKNQMRVVLLWLGAHPQYGPQDAAQSIGAALHALYPYPCKSAS